MTRIPITILAIMLSVMLGRAVADHATGAAVSLVALLVGLGGAAVLVRRG